VVGRAGLRQVLLISPSVAPSKTGLATQSPTRAAAQPDASRGSWPTFMRDGTRAVETISTGEPSGRTACHSSGSTLETRLLP